MHVKVKGVQSGGNSANKLLDSTFLGVRIACYPKAIPGLMVHSF